jgi:hypothetical protein
VPGLGAARQFAGLGRGVHGCLRVFRDADDDGVAVGGATGCRDENGRLAVRALSKVVVGRVTLSTRTERVISIDVDER